MTETQLDQATAHAEANVIQEKTELVARRVIQDMADNPDIKPILPRLGDTAMTEIGDSLLDQIKKNEPPLYDAYMKREQAFSDLVANAHGRYLLPVNVIDRSNYVITREELIEAESNASSGAKARAYERARRDAKSIVEDVTEAILKGNARSYGYLPEYRPIQSEADLACARGKLGELAGDNQYASERDTITEINRRAIRRLGSDNIVGCAMINAEVVRLEKSSSLEGYSLPVGKALSKQAKFDEATKK